MINRVHPENPLRIQINPNNERSSVTSPVRSNSYSKLQSAVTPSNRMTFNFKKDFPSASIKASQKSDPNHLGSPTKLGSPLKKNSSEIDEYEEKFDTKKSLIKLKRNLTNNKAIQEGLMNTIKLEAAGLQQQQRGDSPGTVSNPQQSPLEKTGHSNPTTPKESLSYQNAVASTPLGLEK